VNLVVSLEPDARPPITRWFLGVAGGLLALSLLVGQQSLLNYRWNSDLEGAQSFWSMNFTLWRIFQGALGALLLFVAIRWPRPAFWCLVIAGAACFLTLFEEFCLQGAVLGYTVEHEGVGQALIEVVMSLIGIVSLIAFPVMWAAAMARTQNHEDSFAARAGGVAGVASMVALVILWGWNFLRTASKGFSFGELVIQEPGWGGPLMIAGWILHGAIVAVASFVSIRNAPGASGVRLRSRRIIMLCLAGFFVSLLTTLLFAAGNLLSSQDSTAVLALSLEGLFDTFVRDHVIELTLMLALFVFMRERTRISTPSAST